MRDKLTVYPRVGALADEHYNVADAEIFSVVFFNGDITLRLDRRFHASRFNPQDRIAENKRRAIVFTVQKTHGKIRRHKTDDNSKNNDFYYLFESFYE